MFTSRAACGRLGRESAVPCKNHPDVIENLVKCSRCGEDFCRDCVVELQGNFYCAACKTEQVRDIESGVDETKLDLASILRRFGALLVDGLIFNFTVSILNQFLVAAIVSQSQAAAILVSFIFPFAVWLVYEGLMLQYKGQTLGKMAVRIKVVTPEGNDVTPGQAWLRSFIRLALNLTIIVDYIPAFFSHERRTIHDMAAKTLVINWRP
jgi:uncharacterized RDD family membrane protein YckC